MKLNYSWILVLITLMGWKDPSDSHFRTIPNALYGVAYYASLSHSDDKE